MCTTNHENDIFYGNLPILSLEVFKLIEEQRQLQGQGAKISFVQIHAWNLVKNMATGAAEGKRLTFFGCGLSWNHSVLE